MPQTNNKSSKTASDIAQGDGLNLYFDGSKGVINVIGEGSELKPQQITLGARVVGMTGASLDRKEGNRNLY